MILMTFAKKYFCWHYTLAFIDIFLFGEILQFLFITFSLSQF